MGIFKAGWVLVGIFLARRGWVGFGGELFWLGEDQWGSVGIGAHGINIVIESDTLHTVPRREKSAQIF